MSQTRTRAKAEPTVVDEDQAAAHEKAAAALTADSTPDPAPATDPDADLWSTIPDQDFLYEVGPTGVPHVENEPHSFDVAPFVLELLYELHGELVARRWVEFQQRANAARALPGEL